MPIVEALEAPPPPPTPPKARADARILAVVQDQDGKPIDDAVVSASGRAARSIGGGWYELDERQAGTHTIRCRAPLSGDGSLLAKAQSTFELSPAGETRIVLFTLPTRGNNTVNGQIVTSGGVGSRIDVVFDSPAFEARARTGADGRFTIPNLPRGSYSVRTFYRNGGTRADLTHDTLNVQATMNYTRRLDAGPLKLTLKPPASGRRVELLRAKPNGDGTSAVAVSVASGTTDEDGMLTIDYVAAGTYHLLVAGMTVPAPLIRVEPKGATVTVSVRLPRAPDQR